VDKRQAHPCVYTVTVNVDLSARKDPAPVDGVNLLTRTNAEDFADTAITGDKTGAYSGSIDLAPGDYDYRFRIGADGGENTAVRRFSVLDAPLTIDAGAFDNIEAALPLWVIDHYGPSGFSPDGSDQTVSADAGCPGRPAEARGDCYQVTYDENGGDAFAGVIWLNGDGFGLDTPRPVEDGALNMSFYAWGTNGGEAVGFGYNLVDGGAGLQSNLTLSKTPTKFTVPITIGYDTIQHGFFWSAGLDIAAPGITFYVTDIVIEAGEDKPLSLPLAIDDSFAGRAAFGSDGGAPTHTEDNKCPERATDTAVGQCHRIIWSAPGFSGALWVNGGGFGDTPAVAIDGGPTTLSFYAWGESGGEVLEAGAGLGAQDQGEVRTVLTLSDSPTQYTVDLAGLGPNITGASGPFIFALADGGNPSGATVYIDDIQWTD